MTLYLSEKTTPHLTVKTYGFGAENKVFLGEYEIHLKDFLTATSYVLTNTILNGEEDPRLRFVEWVRSLEVGKGYAAQIGGKDIETSKFSTETPLFPEV